MPTLFNPYVILAFLLWTLSISGFAAYKMHSIDKAFCQVQTDKMVLDAQKRQQEEMGRAVIAATNLEKNNAERYIEYRDREVVVEKLVEKPVYHSQCFDADGVRLLNDTINGKTSAPSGPDSRVPASSVPR